MKLIEFAHDEIGAVGLLPMSAYDNARDKNAAILILHTVQGGIRLGETATLDNLGEAQIGLVFYQEQSVDKFIEALEAVKRTLARQKACESERMGT